MKNASVFAGLFVCLVVGFVVLHQRDAVAERAVAQQASPTQVTVAEQVSVFAPQPEALAKKCSFSSDCSHGKCVKGQCGGCSFSSDCKGWGKCVKGQCGGCSFSSDCKGFGSCSSGHCTKSPY